jgi:AcrR family transcriptional regulator
MKRTRRLLQDSLRALLKVKTLDEILVNDITSAAGINRATFYDHYSDKFGLFNALISAEFSRLLTEQKVSMDESCSSGLAAIVMAVGRYLEQLHGDGVECTRQASTGPLIDAAVTLAVREVFLDGFKKNRGRFLVSREVLASAVSAAVYAAVKESMSKTSWHADERTLRALVPLLLPVIEEAAPASSSVRHRRHLAE